MSEDDLVKERLDLLASLWTYMLIDQPALFSITIDKTIEMEFIQVINVAEALLVQDMERVRDARAQNLSARMAHPQTIAGLLLADKRCERWMRRPAFAEQHYAIRHDFLTNVVNLVARAMIKYAQEARRVENEERP